ncbi:peptidoglycan-binding domain-containing protein [Streptomyces sp. NPDC029216]|uniref:peptidoglycan-binding domain-containing protein n=1 Tax=Streptomyces sp. NPDC029216 TaxID=3154701 RepID=UPI0033FE3E54
MLSQGSSGPAVRQAQCLLNTHLGQHLALDADFGPDTDQAVRQLQHCARLTTDGKIGPDTWKALTNPPATCHTG